MAKAINWPARFREEVLAENCEQLFCALRLGTLYYDHRFWAPGEVVDIRVNHLRVRKAEVVGDLRACPLKALLPEDFARLKTGLRSLAEVVAYLAETYGQPVTEETMVTVVCYRNRPVDPDDVDVPDDPHL